jgi:hypothetical protein
MRFTLSIGLPFFALYAYALLCYWVPWLFPDFCREFAHFISRVLGVLPWELYGLLYRADLLNGPFRIPIQTVWPIFCTCQGFILGAIIDWVLRVMERRGSKGFPFAALGIGVVLLVLSASYYSLLVSIWPSSSYNDSSSTNVSSTDTSTSSTDTTTPASTDTSTSAPTTTTDTTTPAPSQ